MGYKDLLPVGTGLIVSATSFCLGVIFSNWPYDYRTLYSSVPATDEFFKESLEHYKLWGNSPSLILNTYHVVIGIGFIGCFIKIFKPSEEAKMFEYGTLGLYMLATVIYLTNVRTGILSAMYNQWGEVDERTGINVVAASQAMIVFVLVLVLVLQGGLYYAEWENERMLKKYYEEEAEREEKEREEAVIEVGELKEELKEEESKASGVDTPVVEKRQTRSKKGKKKA